MRQRGKAGVMSPPKLRQKPPRMPRASPGEEQHRQGSNGDELSLFWHLRNFERCARVTTPMYRMEVKDGSDQNSLEPRSSPEARARADTRGYWTNYVPDACTHAIACRGLVYTVGGGGA